MRPSALDEVLYRDPYLGVPSAPRAWHRAPVELEAYYVHPLPLRVNQQYGPDVDMHVSRWASP
jgi:hypothetical protein